LLIGLPTGTLRHSNPHPNLHPTIFTWMLSMFQWNRFCQNKASASCRHLPNWSSCTCFHSTDVAGQDLTSLNGLHSLAAAAWKSHPHLPCLPHLARLCFVRTSLNVRNTRIGQSLHCCNSVSPSCLSLISSALQERATATPARDGHSLQNSASSHAVSKIVP